MRSTCNEPSDIIWCEALETKMQVEAMLEKEVDKAQGAGPEEKPTDKNIC